MIDLILTREPDFAPGSAYKYSNSNYALMGLILEKVSGNSLRFLLRDRLFQPLGMKDSFVYRDYEDVSNVAVGYRYSEGKFIKSGTKRPIELDGSGSVVSTLADLARWDASLYTDFPLSEAMKAIAWAPTPLTNGKVSNYGTGWTTSVVNGLRMVSHGGSTLGYTAGFVRLYDKLVSVIVLRNGAGKNAVPLARKILSEVAGVKFSEDGSGS
jgi:CubicO group peptidase (beta-lactamase class C family)